MREEVAEEVEETAAAAAAAWVGVEAAECLERQVLEEVAAAVEKRHVAVSTFLTFQTRKCGARGDL